MPDFEARAAIIEHVLKDELARAGLERSYELTVVDIEGDRDLEERFGLSIPVLTIDGRVAFKGRLTASAFQKKFKRLTTR